MLCAVGYLSIIEQVKRFKSRHNPPIFSAHGKVDKGSASVQRGENPNARVYICIALDAIPLRSSWG